MIVKGVLGSYIRVRRAAAYLQKLGEGQLGCRSPVPLIYRHRTPLDPYPAPADRQPALLLCMYRNTLYSHSLFHLNNVK